MKQLTLNGVNGHADAASRIGHLVFAKILRAREGNPKFRLTEAAFIECLRPVLADELPAVKRVDKRNPLFDALAEGCGYTHPVTRAAAGTVATALRGILEVEPAVTPEALKSTAIAVTKKFPDAGPRAVESHWGEFYWARKKRAVTQEDAPKGWLTRLNEKFPECVYAKGQPLEITHESPYEWNRISPQIQAVLK